MSPILDFKIDGFKKVDDDEEWHNWTEVVTSVVKIPMLFHPYLRYTLFTFILLSKYWIHLETNSPTFDYKPQNYRVVSVH